MIILSRVFRTTTREWIEKSTETRCSTKKMMRGRNAKKNSIGLRKKLASKTPSLTKSL